MPVGVRSAHIWWQLWGGSTPALQYDIVSMRVTAQTAAASATEELWSEYDFVANQRPTSVLKDRAEKLVRVHAGRESWITLRITFPNKIAALRILTRNSNFNMNRTRYNFENTQHTHNNNVTK